MKRGGPFPTAAVRDSPHPAAGRPPQPPAPATRHRPAISPDTVLKAFQTHRLVGIGEAHDLQHHHDALEMLLTDPRLPEVADLIVVEFGNANYQDTIDRFIGGQPVADADPAPGMAEHLTIPAEHLGRAGL